MTPHKHAELIKAWADGAEIQKYCNKPKNSQVNVQGFIPRWVDEITPSWGYGYEYRIKPTPKPDVISFASVTWIGSFVTLAVMDSNIKLTWDGETGELKSAEVLKG